ncbi:uncharacterized protein LOC141650998 [Silene latifolia]|uniref:uncharacterized protein LOC141650998 n=1 Tax=Silene latifolia TaxID=37657 RepID=UPI003D77C24B
MAVNNDTIEKVENSIVEDRLRSSSVSSRSSKSGSSEFSFEDPDINEESITVAPATPEFTPRLETPPVQVMERPPSGSAGYRIPSHVFARNKSNNRNPDWSAASNDSLFSINTGNMSFTTDQFTGLLKSCELGKSGEVPHPAPRIVLKSVEKMTLIPPDQTRKSGEEQVIVATPPPAVNTPAADVEVIDEPEVIKNVIVTQELNVNVNVNKDDAKEEVEVTKNGRSCLPDDEVLPRKSVSPKSKASGEQSFAFPVFSETDKEKSVNSGENRVEQQKDLSSVDLDQGLKTQTSAPGAAPPSASWLSYFTCGPCT